MDVTYNLGIKIVRSSLLSLLRLGNREDWPGIRT
jgi:hypothetical protein